MNFHRRNGVLYAEDLPLNSLATRYGTPLYVYSKAQLQYNYKAFVNAFHFIDHQVCFAVKANSNLAVLNVLARLGAGFDIVSGGELKRVIAAGGEPSKVVYSGLGKTEQEMEEALRLGIKCFNVESDSELILLNQVAKRVGKCAPVSLRVNPDIDPKTHPYITTGIKQNKFGIPSESVLKTYKKAVTLDGLEIMGISYHIGSQLTSKLPFKDALDKVAIMVRELTKLGINLRHIDIGGGLGVRYCQETPPSPEEYASSLRPQLERLRLKLYMEPGRAICANAGVLLTKVLLLKSTEGQNFAVVDAAMNDLARPSLYNVWMDIQEVEAPQESGKVWDIVGPICETTDFLGKQRKMTLHENDVLAVMSAGAYGFVMSSNYNTRARAAEVMVDGRTPYLVRERERTENLWASEKILPLTCNLPLNSK